MNIRKFGDIPIYRDGNVFEGGRYSTEVGVNPWANVKDVNRSINYEPISDAEVRRIEGSDGGILHIPTTWSIYYLKDPKTGKIIRAAQKVPRHTRFPGVHVASPVFENENPELFNQMLQDFEQNKKLIK